MTFFKIDAQSEHGFVKQYLFLFPEMETKKKKKCKKIV